MKTTKIIIAGMGGQGVQVLGKILGQAAAQNGLAASYIPLFGVEQRGAPSVAYIIINDTQVRYPLFKTADWALILHPRATDVVANHISQKTKVIFDSSLMAPPMINKKPAELLGLPATKLANEKFFIKAANLIILGKIARELGLPENLIWQETETVMSKKLKNEKTKDKSRSAITWGYKITLEINNFSLPSFQPKKGVINLKGADKHGWLIPERCKGCGICLAKCPAGAVKFSAHTGSFATSLPEIDLTKCTACGNCFLFCPDGAIKIEKDKK